MCSNDIPKNMPICKQLIEVKYNPKTREVFLLYALNTEFKLHGYGDYNEAKKEIVMDGTSQVIAF